MPIRNNNMIDNILGQKKTKKNKSAALLLTSHKATFCIVTVLLELMLHSGCFKVWWLAYHLNLLPPQVLLHCHAALSQLADLPESPLVCKHTDTTASLHHMIATTAYHAGKVHTIRAHKAYIDNRLTRQTCILIYDFQIWIFSAGLAELAQKGSILVTHGQRKSLTPFNNAFLDGSWNKGYKGWAHWGKWLTSGQATDSCCSNMAL